MIPVFLFIFGLAIGSFINVVASRYDPDRALFALRSIGGRSRCPSCGKTLRWYDLVPLLSFLFLRGRCRHCEDKISLQYPVVELFTGLAFLSPLYFYHYYHIANLAAVGASLLWFYALSLIWVLALASFILLALIDLRLYIIPNGLNFFIALLGVAKIIILYAANKLDVSFASFSGAYAMLFGLQSPLWLNYIFAALFGAAFFGTIIYVTKGKGMGMGDMKLAAALGLLFGWPDIALIIVIAFLSGSAYGIALMALKRAGLKDAVPFGPFIVLGAIITMFFGSRLLDLYFTTFHI